MKKNIALTLLTMSACALVACGDQDTKTGKAKDDGKGGAEIATISPNGHEAIKATIVDKSPNSFTIDVKKFANMNVDEEAPTFAVYTADDIPQTCGDFRKLELAYTKPEKYIRQFDLSDHKEVLAAIAKYHCVVMKNIPPAK